MPGPDPNAVRVGDLRWPVVIATRDQAADPNSAGILETFEDRQKVRARILPIGALTFYAAEQVDRLVTHAITIRWLDWVDATCVIFRTTTRPDKSERVERFRIRRVMEIDGRTRFLRCDCELEKRD